MCLEISKRWRFIDNITGSQIEIVYLFSGADFEYHIFSFEEHTMLTMYAQNEI